MNHEQKEKGVLVAVLKTLSPTVHKLTAEVRPQTLNKHINYVSIGAMEWGPQLSQHVEQRINSCKDNARSDPHIIIVYF